MKIARIQSTITHHPIREERVVVSAAGRHSESTFLMVVVEDENGLHGFGEAATTLLWSGESAHTAKWIVDSLFAPKLVGATFDHPREALAVMDIATWGNSFTKSAVDCALWDLWAKRQGVPVWKLFADRDPVRAIPSRISIGAYPTEKTVALAREFWAAGIRTLKFKTGVAGIDDVARLRAVREVLGDTPAFTVDYNGAFNDVDAAVKHIESLTSFKLALVEQPTHRDRIHQMAEVKKRVDVPILADESIFTPEHLAEAIDLDAFDILSVYPGKNGGFTRSIDMARMAAKDGKPCVIGSNLESDLGQAAMATLAAGLSAFPIPKLSNDFASAMYYTKSSTTPALQFKKGELHVPAGIGFGVTPMGMKA